MNSQARNSLYNAQRLANRAIDELAADPTPFDTAKTLALAKLMASLVSVQHRLKTCYGRKPKRKAAVHQAEPHPKISAPPPTLGLPVSNVTNGVTHPPTENENESEPGTRTQTTSKSED